MESLGGIFLLGLLGIGLLLLMFRNGRILGVLAILAAMAGLFLIPVNWFYNFKKKTHGIYYSTSNKKLVISDDGTYKIYKDGKVIESSGVTYSNIDNGNVYFDGNTALEYKEDGTIINKNDPAEVYAK